MELAVPLLVVVAIGALIAFLVPKIARILGDRKSVV